MPGLEDGTVQDLIQFATSTGAVGAYLRQIPCQPILYTVRVTDILHVML